MDIKKIKEFLSINYKLFLPIVIFILILDQSTKLLVIKYIEYTDTVPVIPHFFQLTHLVNTGSAFGFLDSVQSVYKEIFYLVLTPTACIYIFFLIRSLKPHQKLSFIGLSALFAGAIGNYIDRLLWGHVIDFLDIYISSYHWPAFNVADSSIVLGVLTTLICTFLEEKKKA